MPILIRDFRCSKCGRLLFRAHIPPAPDFYIEIRCNHQHCNTLNVFRPALPGPEAVRAEIIQTQKEESHDASISTSIAVYARAAE